MYKTHCFCKEISEFSEIIKQIYNNNIKCLKTALIQLDMVSGALGKKGALHDEP